MTAFFRSIGRFINAMDAKAYTSFVVSVVLLIFVLLMFFFGQDWLALKQDGALTDIMTRAHNSPWALGIVICIFALLALTGFPQILLITATVIAFGAQKGAIYAWAATMVSASFTFALGHYLGGGAVERFGGLRVKSTINFIKKHGIVASGLVRVVPSAPFIVVNAAAGAAHIPIWKFWAGTAMGIIPKIALVAFIGSVAPDQRVLRDGVSGVVEFFKSRSLLDFAVVLLVIAAWLVFLLVVRRIYTRMRDQGENS